MFQVCLVLVATNVLLLLGSKITWPADLPLLWIEELSLVDQTQRSLEPVSKSRLTICAGVPIETGQRYSLSFWMSSAATVPVVPVAELYLTSFICGAEEA